MPGVKTTLNRVNSVLDSMEVILADIRKNQNVEINTEKDRVSYKDGLVDGLCMMSWEGKKVDGVKYDYVGESNAQGTGKLLSEVLVEIGSVYGFDGEEELLRVKEDCKEDEEEISVDVKPELKEVTDEDVNDDNETAGCSDG